MTARIAWTLAMLVALLAVPFLVMAVVDGQRGPAGHGLVAACSRYCHDHGCPHVEPRYDWDAPGPRLARQVYLANIEALRQPTLGYQGTNLAVYVVGLPALYGALVGVLLWPTRALGRGHLLVLLGVAGLDLALFTGAASAPFTPGAWGGGPSAVYWYCTDFCIHAANGFGITYDELNFVLFVLGFPATGVLLVTAVLGRLWGWIRSRPGPVRRPRGR